MKSRTGRAVGPSTRTPVEAAAGLSGTREPPHAGSTGARAPSKPRSGVRIACAVALLAVAATLTAPCPAGAGPRAEEGRTLYFDVALAETPGSGCKIEYNYFTESGSAKQGTDFKAARGKLVFLRGDRTKRIGVVTLTDKCLEQDETVELVVTDGVSVSIADWAGWCHHVEIWRKKRFEGTIVDDGSASSSTYEDQKYGCGGGGDGTVQHGE